MMMMMLYVDEALSDIFSPVKRSSDDGSGMTLYICFRHNHVPVLHIRNAR